MKQRSIRSQKELMKELKRRKVEVILTGNNHLKIICPQGPVYFGSTPSDPRAVRNAVGAIRRAGLDLERGP
jgi:hypothetical protein